MSHLLKIQVPKARINERAVILYLLYAVIMLWALQTYISWQSVNVVLGLGALPLVTTIQPNNKSAVRFAIAALFFGIISLLLPVKTLLYFTIVCAAFFITESFAGKINLLPVLVTLLMSPVFQYFSNVFSFPIRLQLTAWAGYLMNIAGVEAIVKGNMIYHNGNEFAVDPACMGLSMLITSLSLQVMVMAVYQKRYSLHLSWAWVSVLMVLAFGLNVLSNLFRIICLVWFNILPDTMMHEVTGILSLLAYVIVPMVFLTRTLIIKKGRANVDNKAIASLSSNTLIALHTLLLVITGLAAYTIMRHDKSMNDISARVPAVPGYTTQRITADIIKLENKRSLIYIKGIPAFYNAEHNPMICWSGSGYVFRQAEKEIINGISIYTALLENGNEQLYTAWWYDNGSTRTIDQFVWRWDVLTGAKNYSVVNVTTANKEQLTRAISELLCDNRLKPLL